MVLVQQVKINNMSEAKIYIFILKDGSSTIIIGAINEERARYNLSKLVVDTSLWELDAVEGD